MRRLRARRASLVERIDEALARRGGRATAYDLAVDLFESPRSWRCSSNGGPPGCFMALGSALRRGGFRVDVEGPGPGQRFVRARRAHS